MKNVVWVILLVLFSLVLSCGAEVLPSSAGLSTADPLLHNAGAGDASTGDANTGDAPAEVDEMYLPVVVKPRAEIGLTYARADGNRLMDGYGRLPASDPLDIVLSGRPVWVAATGVMTGTVWAVALDDGRVQAFAVTGNVANEVVTEAVTEVVNEVAIVPNRLPIGAPPLLQIVDGLPRLLVSDEPASAQTHSVMLPQRDAIVTVEPAGDLVVQRDGQSTRLAVDALLDGRILVDEHERVLFYSNPTERYGHAVLGDQIEAAGITLVEIDPVPRVVRTIAISAPDVIEGIAPIWADLDGDGVREIIVTLSNEDVGAWIAVYSEMGELVATGPSIGRGFRWRHQLAVAPFGPAGEVELVDVLTPHIGGVVEFYSFNRAASGGGGSNDNMLEIVAQQSGYTSHVIGTRNLDMAVAGDFDGDGQVELLLPNQARTELGAIRRTGDGAEVAWSLAVGGEVVTNLAAATLGDRLLVGVGRNDGVLRIWGE